MRRFPNRVRVFSVFFLLLGGTGQGLLLASPPDPKQPSRSSLPASRFRAPVRFERNEGQTDSRVRFLTRGPDYTLFLTDNGAVFTIQSSRPDSESPDGSAKEEAVSAIRKTVIRMELAGADIPNAIVGEVGLLEKVHYFLGEDPEEWRPNVPLYGQVRYREVYPGIDLVFQGNSGDLEFDFVVSPGSDPRAILLNFDGMESFGLDEAGNLILSHDGGEMVHHAPEIYQEAETGRSRVAGRFVMRGSNQVGFEVDSYDPSLPLVIDPVLTFLTYLGGTGWGQDRGRDITVDDEGYIYIFGAAHSIDFPSIPFAAATTGTFLSKLDPTGSQLLFTSYYGSTVGGAYSDIGPMAVMRDELGSIYLAGGTSSEHFPITPDALHPSRIPDGQNGYLIKVSSDGSTIHYSTYLPGPIAEMALTADGSVLVAGQSNILTTTPNAFRPIGAGAFAAKIDIEAGQYVYATYLGLASSVTGLALDSAGNAYFVGTAHSFGSQIFDGAFVLGLNSSGTEEIYQVNLKAGVGLETGEGIALDAAGNAIVVGGTPSHDFPVTPDALQGQCGNSESGGCSDAFLVKLDGTGSVVYSTFLGGISSERVSDIAIDGSGAVYVIGQTSSDDFPLVEPFQNAFGGGGASFVTKISPDLTEISFSTVLGFEEGVDGFVSSSEVNAIFIASDDTAYIVGMGGPYTMPSTQGAFQRFAAGFNDVIVAKISEVGPRISGLVPPSKFVLAPVLTVEVQGSDFVPGSIVEVNQNASATTYIDSSNLVFQLNSRDIRHGGRLHIRVHNPTDPFGTSGESIYEVIHEIPQIDLIVPHETTQFLDVDIVVRGSGFTPDTEVLFEGVVHTPFFRSASELFVILNKDLILTHIPRTVGFKVRNPAPGGGLSNTVDFHISDVTFVPSIISIFPTSVPAGRNSAVDVAGSGFIASSEVVSDGVPTSTSALSIGALRASIGFPIDKPAGPVEITVFNPEPGGGTSNPVTFDVTEPGGNLQPSLRELIPAVALVGDEGFMMTVIGQFDPDTVFRWNGSPRPTTYIYGWKLEVSIPASDLDVAGVYPVTLFAPAPGGGESLPILFTVQPDNPVPAFINFYTEPPDLIVGMETGRVRLYGERFIEGTVGRINGNERPTTIVHRTQAFFDLLPEDFTAPSRHRLSIVNPPPGGGVSEEKFVLVDYLSPHIGPLNPETISAGGPDFKITVTGGQFETDAVVRWWDEDRPTVFVSDTELRATIFATDISAGQGAEVRVLNRSTNKRSYPRKFKVSSYYLTVTPATARVTAGQRVFYNIGVQPRNGSFDALVSLSCSGLPSTATCSLLPTEVTPGATSSGSTLTVQTTARAGGYGIPGVGPNFPFGWILTAGVFLLLWVHASSGAWPARRFGIVRDMATFVILWTLLISCGGSSPEPPSPPPPPSQTLVFSVTATSGLYSQSQSVTIVIE